MATAKAEVPHQNRGLKRKNEAEKSFEVKRVKLDPQKNRPNQKILSFSLKHASVVKKAKRLLDFVSSCVFALPFLTSEQQFCKSPQSIDEVKAKIDRLGYSNTTEILEDLDNILNTPPQLDETPLIVNGTELTASREDINMMAKQLKLKVSIWSEQLFVDEEALATPNNLAILEALVRRFPMSPRTS